MKSRSFRIGIQLTTLLLPWKLRRPLLQRTLRWQLDSSCRIGLSLVDAETLRMGPGAYIGHFNIINRLRRLEMDTDAVIAKYNWIRVGSFSKLDESEAPGFLEMGRESFFTMMHFIDCSGGMIMEEGAALGGARSVAFGHGIDTETVRQSTKLTRIGANTIVAAHVTITPGATVAPGCLIGAGSVVVGHLDTPGMIYAGSPAKAVKKLPENFSQRDSRDFA